jgi:hypothetical protein
LWADRLSPIREARRRHPLETEMGLTWEAILDSIDEAFRLKVAVYGRAAEKHLERTLIDSRAFDRVSAIDADGRPDFSVRYRGVDFTIECKNVLRAQSRRGIKVDFQKTRAAKNNPCSRYYSPNDFDVLAACLYPVTEEWRFEYCPTVTMLEHPRCPGRLANNVYVGSGGVWAENLLLVLDGLLSRR